MPLAVHWLMVALRVIRAVATDARDGLVIVDLVQQARQHRRVPGGVVGHFDGPDFQRGRVNAQMDLAPLTTVVGTMLFGLPFAFAQYLDTAAVVDQQVQCSRSRLRADHHRQKLLAPAHSAEVGNFLVQADQLEQTLRHAHRLAQRQIEKAFDGQGELNRRLAVLPAAPRLPLALPCQRMSLSSQISSEPRAFNAAL